MSGFRTVVTRVATVVPILPYQKFRWACNPFQRLLLLYRIHGDEKCHFFIHMVFLCTPGAVGPVRPMLCWVGQVPLAAFVVHRT